MFIKRTRVLRVAESFRGKYLRSQAKFFPISILTNFSDPLFHFPFHPTLHRFPLPSFLLNPPHLLCPSYPLIVHPPLYHPLFITLYSILPHSPPLYDYPAYQYFTLLFPLLLCISLAIIPPSISSSLSHNSFFYHHIQ